VKLLNFNVAWSRLPAREPTPSSEAPRGDLVYAAPERLLPDGGHVPDARSDLFSLGLVLLELLTGQHLYYLPALEKRLVHVLAGAGQASELEELGPRADSFRAEDVAQAVKPLAPAVQAVLRKLLRREVPERHATGEALQADLRRCLQSLRPGYGAKQVARELARLEAEVAPLRYQAEAAGTFSEPPALPVSPEGDTP
jgi:serine/threonine-protein kinase